ncbi:MAG: hypothetical protein WA061_01755 [Microgenomates group bacterium]
MEKIEIEFNGIHRRSIYGGFVYEAFYTMSHRNNGKTNQYDIACEIVGLEEGRPSFYPTSASFVGDFEKYGNEETLTNDAAIELFEEFVRTS